MTAPPTKSPAILDAMVQHVRYELDQFMSLRRYGNSWATMLGSPRDRFAINATLEATMIHARCLYEFLTGSKGDRINARDYVHGWKWPTPESLDRGIEAVHARVAHIGLDRHSVGTEGAFRWDDWLDKHEATLLKGMRDFLAGLPADRYSQFVYPTPYYEPLDLIEVLDALIDQL